MPSDTPSTDSAGSTPAPSRDDAKPTRSCKLSGNVLSIRLGDDITDYRLEEIDSHPLCGRPAFRLTKLVNGEPAEFYEVIRTDWGDQCDCADWTFRHQNTADTCKHIASLRAIGKLRAP